MSKTIEKIETVDVVAKEWFDRVNGNSYFSARVVLNYGMEGDKTLFIPFQYGYGDHYLCEALKAIREHLNVSDNDPTHLRLWCEANDVVLRYDKHENCLKRECIVFGKEVEA